MPEGDTVYNTARALERALVGEVLTGSDLRVPALATVDLTGWLVVESATRGKHLLLRLSNGVRRMTLHSHLRMDGAWRVYPPRAPWRPPSHLIRVVLRTEPAVAVGYHLHEVALVPTDREDQLVGHLGPDLLGADWDAAEAVRRLRATPTRPVGEALMDQRNLAGIGNLYKAEVLFLRGISPWTSVSDVDNLEAVVLLAHRLLNAHRGRWTQVTTGSRRRGEETYVYGRAGAACRRCGTLVRRDVLDERVTYWCPSCQPGPAPAGSIRPSGS